MPGGQGRDGGGIDPSTQENADWDIRLQPAADGFIESMDQLLSPDAFWILRDRLERIELEFPVLSDLAAEIWERHFHPVAGRKLFYPGKRVRGAGMKP